MICIKIRFNWRHIIILFFKKPAQMKLVPFWFITVRPIYWPNPSCRCNCRTYPYFPRWNGRFPFAIVQPRRINIVYENDLRFAKNIYNCWKYLFECFQCICSEFFQINFWHRQCFHAGNQCQCFIVDMGCLLQCIAWQANSILECILGLLDFICNICS